MKGTRGNTQIETTNASNQNEIEIQYNIQCDTCNSSSSNNRLSDSLSDRIDESIVRLSSYWSSVRIQVSNYCDDFKRRLLDNL